MHKTANATAASLAALALLLLAPAPSFAAPEEGDDDASAHVLEAEIALHRMDYLEAAREYRRAAERSESVEIARQATRIASSFGFNDEALLAARRWLELEEDSDEALFHLARLELREGNLRAARRHYKALLERADGPEDMRLLSLLSVFSEEDPDKVYDVMRRLARPYDDSAAAQYAVAVAALQADELDAARRHIDTALELEPEAWLETKAKLLYGRVLLLSGEPDEAIDYVARIIGDDPRPDPEARLELALIMMSAGRDDDALSQVNQVLLENSNAVDALRLMAIINFRQENLDAARQDFEDLLASGRHTMDALYYLARIADYREETERAIDLYSRVTSGPQAVVSQRRAAGLVALRRDAPETALERLDEFAREFPQYGIDMVEARAQLLGSLERYDEALEQYDRLIRYRPDSENALLGRAALLLEMDRLDDAIEQYREAVDRWPDSALSLNALGYTLADRTNRYREAEKLIRKALENDPENPAIIDSMGWVLYKLGEPEKALVELERAYEMFDDPEIAAHIVEVLAALGRRDEALERLLAAESKNPDSTLLEGVRERLFADAD
jgi:tetratricopeptide (TPR) repeat protein